MLSSSLLWWIVRVCFKFQPEMKTKDVPVLFFSQWKLQNPTFLWHKLHASPKGSKQSPCYFRCFLNRCFSIVLDGRLRLNDTRSQRNVADIWEFFFFTAADTYLLLHLNHSFTLDQYIILSKKRSPGVCCGRHVALNNVLLFIFLRDKLVNTHWLPPSCCGILRWSLYLAVR